jgi:2-keto-4-pentenoate hydratase
LTANIGHVDVRRSRFTAPSDEESMTAALESRTLDTDLAVSTLVDAAKSGRLLDALPPSARPATIAEGYEIQERFVAALGETTVGWKLGVGSPKGKRDTGIGRAAAGRVLKSRVFGPNESISMRWPTPITMEFEMAFVLSRDVLPGDVVDDVRSLIGETRLTSEWVRARYVDRRAVGWPSFVADNSAFDTLVVGPRIELDHFDEIMRTLSVLVDGGERVRAMQGDEVTNPIDALEGLVAIGRGTGMTLPKGAIVSTGTMSVPFNVTAPCVLSARCCDGELGFRITA